MELFSKKSKSLKVSIIIVQIAFALMCLIGLLYSISVISDLGEKNSNGLYGIFLSIISCGACIAFEKLKTKLLLRENYSLAFDTTEVE